MHPLFQQASEMTHDIIGAAIDVHRDKGPGLLESIYEWCFCKELEIRGHSVEQQRTARICYKGFEREELLKVRRINRWMPLGRTEGRQLGSSDSQSPVAQLHEYPESSVRAAH